MFDPDVDRFGGITVFEFDPATFQLTRRIHADGAHWEPSLKKWVFENGWVRSLNGASIQEYRTFDVATFKELGEDPSYFKKEVRQSSEMDYEELRNYIQRPAAERLRHRPPEGAIAEEDRISRSSPW